MKRKCGCFLLTTLISLVAFVSGGVPEKRMPVAEGFANWENATEKNWLKKGRKVEPSDLRHKVVVVCAVDAAKFDQKQALELACVAKKFSLPQFANWDTAEMPRDTIVVFSVRGDIAKERFDSVWQKPKDEGAVAAFSNRMAPYGLGCTPFYRELSMDGEPSDIAGHYPYVYVIGAEGIEPVYSQGEFSATKHIKAFDAAVSKAVAKLPKWVPCFGVEEPQYFKKVPQLVEKGKTAQALKLLQGGIAEKDVERAKEAQIMYDALMQYKSELIFRISVEWDRASPARAYVDMQELFRLFPSEKKSLKKIETAIKANKDIVTLGKIMEKVMVWGRPDFLCKSVGEAKKLTAELQKMKKTVDVIAESKNVALQGEALLLQSQMDTLIAEMPTKVGEK